MRNFFFRHAETTTFGVITAVLAIAVVWNTSAANAEVDLKAEAAAAVEVKIPTKEDKLAAFALQRDPLSAEELKELLSLVGFEGRALKQAWAIAMTESNGRPKAHNTNTHTGDNSYGLFQINMLGYLGTDRRDRYDLKSNAELLNPVLNAQIAFQMSGRGNDFSSWKVYGYNNGGERYLGMLADFPSERVSK
jgi:hypothetical protein